MTKCMITVEGIFDTFSALICTPFKKGTGILNENYIPKPSKSNILKRADTWKKNRHFNEENNIPGPF